MKKLVFKFRFFIHSINLSRTVCTHLFSKEHTDSHRMGVGIVFIVIGVAISKIHTDLHSVHFLLDGIGYGVHGIGVTPFIDILAAYGKEEAKKVEEEVKKEVEEVEEK